MPHQPNYDTERTATNKTKNSHIVLEILSQQERFYFLLFHESHFQLQSDYNHWQPVEILCMLWVHRCPLYELIYILQRGLYRTSPVLCSNLHWSTSLPTTYAAPVSSVENESDSFLDQVGLLWDMAPNDLEREEQMKEVYPQQKQIQELQSIHSNVKKIQICYW